MKKNLGSLLAFTLVELVVAVTISSIIFLGILNLVGDTLHELGISNRSSKLIVSLNEVVHTFEALSRSYENKKILISEDDGEGTDVLLLFNSGSLGGVVIALIDPNSKQIYNSSVSYALYNKKHIGYRTLNATEFSAINVDSNEVYNLKFLTDKIFYNIHFRDFQMQLFNSGTVSDMDMSLVLQYGKKSEGIPWKDLGSDGIYSVNLNF